MGKTFLYGEAPVYHLGDRHPGEHAKPGVANQPL
jgi:hypothetical protein